MERETQTIITPVGKVEVVIKKWLTGGEKMAIMKVQAEQFVDWMLENLVVSPSLDALKELHGKDFDFLLSKLRDVIDESTWKEEKKE